MIGLVIRLYPRAWRERYGEEFRALVEETGLDARSILDIAVHALIARVHAHRVGLAQVAALTVFVLADAAAVRGGYSDNMFWLPRGPGSAALLAVVAGALAVAVVPTALRLYAAGRRRLRRCAAG